MKYDNYLFLGMHRVWWFVLAVMVFWIFASIYYMVRNKTKKKEPLHILIQQLVAGQIDITEYKEMKRNITW